MKSGGIRKPDRVSEKPVAPEVQARRDFAEVNRLGTKPVTVDRFDRTDGEFEKRFGAGVGTVRAGRFADKAPVSSVIPGDTLRVQAGAAHLMATTDTKRAGQFLKRALRNWREPELTRLFERLFERRSEITSHRDFRNLLDRDQNLFANQLTREANNNIAYRSVDFDIIGMSDDEIWRRIDESPYRPLINDNAARAMLQMVEKFGIA